MDEDDYGDSDEEKDEDEIDCIESVYGKRYDHTKIEVNTVLNSNGTIKVFCSSNCIKK